MNNEWLLDQELIHLNHAAVGPWPARTRDAVMAFCEQNIRFGSLHYPQWLDVETRLKQRLAQLINAADESSIALLKNTSEGLSIVANGIDWQPGDEIIISDEEFPSNRIVWQALASQGVRVTQVNLSTSSDPEAALLQSFGPATRMLAISSVQYASGLRLDVNRLGKACMDLDILFCVDAIQELGALQFDVQKNLADFVVADGHKWMLGPEGVALFYCKPERIEDLSLSQFGWHMIEEPTDYSRKDWKPAQTARRFECGSPNMLGIHALEASLSLLLEIGIEKIENDILYKTNRLLELIKADSRLSLLSNTEQTRRSGIITFRAPEIKSDQLYSSLMSKNILCANRGGGIRFSPHYYTPDDHLDAAVQQVLELIN